jgi:hypothetical protein
MIKVGRYAADAVQAARDLSGYVAGEAVACLSSEVYFRGRREYDPASVASRYLLVLRPWSLLGPARAPPTERIEASDSKQRTATAVRAVPGQRTNRSHAVPWFSSPLPLNQPDSRFESEGAHLKFKFKFRTAVLIRDGHFGALTPI